MDIPHVIPRPKDSGFARSVRKQPGAIGFGRAVMWIGLVVKSIPSGAYSRVLDFDAYVATPVRWGQIITSWLSDRIGLPLLIRLYGPAGVSAIASPIFVFAGPELPWSMFLPL
jgi:hypothetical protein